MVRPARSRRLPAPLLDEGDGRRRRHLPRPSADRHLQLVVGARQLQRPSAWRRRGGQAGRPAGRRLPAGVPGHVARRGAYEAHDDALPQPHGDGRRGVDPLLSARRGRAAHGMRQDQPRVGPRRLLGRHPGHRRDGRADAQRPLARQGRSDPARTAGTTTRSCGPGGSPSRTSARSRTRCRAPTGTA